jgi:hypothetical protein
MFHNMFENGDTDAENDDDGEGGRSGGKCGRSLVKRRRKGSASTPVVASRSSSRVPNGASLATASPLVLRPVDRNRYDGYIRKAMDQVRKVRSVVSREVYQ